MRKVRQVHFTNELYYKPPPSRDPQESTASGCASPAVAAPPPAEDTNINDDHGADAEDDQDGPLNTRRPPASRRRAPTSRSRAPDPTHGAIDACTPAIQPMTDYGNKDGTNGNSRYPRRSRRITSYYGINEDIEDGNITCSHFISNVLHSSQDIFVPSNYHEAVTCANSKQWLEAMRDEIKCFTSNDTYDLVPLPRGRNA